MVGVQGPVPGGDTQSSSLVDQQRWGIGFIEKYDAKSQHQQLENAGDLDSSQ